MSLYIKTVTKRELAGETQDAFNEGLASFLRKEDAQLVAFTFDGPLVYAAFEPNPPKAK